MTPRAQHAPVEKGSAGPARRGGGRGQESAASGLGESPAGAWHRLAWGAGGVQPKLTVNTPGDRWEQEADRVADQVLRMPAPGAAGRAAPVQRKCAACEEAEEEEVQRMCAECAEEEAVQRRPAAGSVYFSAPPAIQRKAGPAAAPRAQAAPGVSGAGAPLDAGVRRFMEPRFGTDFGDVRVHVNGEATRAARQLNARAYTAGRHVVFGAGQYRPQSEGGRRLIAHELAHVIQQTGASVPAVQRAAADDAGSDYDIGETISTLRIALRVALTAQGDPTIPSERKAKIRNRFNRLLPLLGRLEAARERDGEGVTFGFDPDPKKNEINPGDSERSLAELYAGWIDPPRPREGAGEPTLQAWALPGGLRLTPYGGAEAQRCELICVGAIVLAGLLLAGCKSSSGTRSSACNASESREIGSFHSQGEEWVQRAAQRLAAYRDGSASTAHRSVVEQALRANFHTTESGTVGTIATRLDSIKTFFARGATSIGYKCNCSSDSDAYTVGTEIHLCPRWFNSSDRIRRVTTVIHEVGHATGLEGSLPLSSGRVEDIYEFHGGYSTMRPQQAITNPDPYAVFARQVFHDGGHPPGTHR